MSISKPLFDFHYQDQQIYHPDLKESISPLINDFNSSIKYHKNLPGYKPSPLYNLKNLASELCLGKILCKNEAERFGVPAIKMLGASWAMHKILYKDSQVSSFCTATDGNHGRAVAWSAKQFNKNALVFVPKNTVRSRIQNIKNEGAEVIIINGNYDEAVTTAEKYSIENNCSLIQDTAWEGYTEIPALITSGYYTQMAEIENQTKEFDDQIDIIFLQTGVGSWPSAITHYVRNHPKLKKTKIVCVEPMESDCFLQSAKNNKLSATKKTQKTIMAGLNCGTPSILAWEIMKTGIDVFLSIDDSYAVQAMQKYYFPNVDDKHIEAGESGAAGLAGLIALLSDPILNDLKNRLELNNTTKVLLFNTEGITDPELFAKIVI